MALSSAVGGPGSVKLGQAWGAGPTALALHSSAGRASCRHLCLLFSLFSLLSQVGQLWAWADLEGRTQAGQWRLGVGTQLETPRFKIVGNPEGRGICQSHPANQWQGQSPALCTF